MRWQEEVTLTTYEMQWTVAFFVYNSRKWGSHVGGSSGAVAYANRKHAMWRDQGLSADRIFRLLNKAYKSPL
jgi:hypothetical protein